MAPQTAGVAVKVTRTKIMGTGRGRARRQTGKGGEGINTPLVGDAFE